MGTGSPKLLFVINTEPGVGGVRNGGGKREEGIGSNGRPSHRVVIVALAVTLVNLSRQKVTSAFCSRRGRKKNFTAVRVLGAQMKPYRCANDDGERAITGMQGFDFGHELYISHRSREVSL